MTFFAFRLEDPDSDETKEFVDKQSELTDSVLAVCDLREKLRQQITALYDHPRYDTPFRRGNRYFYFHNTGLQAQRVLYVQVLTGIGNVGIFICWIGLIFIVGL